MKSVTKSISMNVTFSPSTVLFPQFSFDPHKFLSDVNNILNTSFGNEENFEEISVPDDLQHKPKSIIVREMASDIAEKLDNFKETKKIDDISLLSSFIGSNLKFPHFKFNKNENDYNMSLVQLLQRKKYGVELPRFGKLANDILFSIKLLSVQQSGLNMKPKLNQWIIALCSNTLKSLTKMFKCPLCELSRRMNQSHLIPSMLSSENNVIYDIDDDFDIPLSFLTDSMNKSLQYTSEGGCTHTIIVDSCFAVTVTNPNAFPVEIGGKGATPPSCMRCCNNSGPIFIKNEKGISFVCSECFKSEDTNPDTFTTNLSDFFFGTK